MDSFCISLSNDDLNNPDTMAKFQEVMDEIHDQIEDHIKELAQELNVSEDCAMDVWYLRSRSRWTEELEQKLIEQHQAGHRPDMNEFGN